MKIEGDFAFDKNTREIRRCDETDDIKCEDCLFNTRNCFESDKIQWLYEEYKEPILSDDELELINVLSKINGEEYKYIYKRDKYIFIFSDKPDVCKYGVRFKGNPLEMTGLTDLFSNIKFENGLYDIENKCFIKE